jgi:tetratricopeptide (TPR) repeat protein
MSLKYRVRLENDRVIGPFTADEVAELYVKKHITGKEKCQQFPIGDWKNLSQFPALVELIKKANAENPEQAPTQNNSLSSKATNESSSVEVNRNSKNSAPSTNNSSGKKEVTRSGINAFQEFKFGKNVSIDVDYDELEKKYKEIKQDNEEDEENFNAVDEKTRLVYRGGARVNVDKTVVLSTKSKPLLEDVTVERTTQDDEEEKAREEAKAARERVPTEFDLKNEKTEMVNIKNILPSINAALKAAEVDLEHMQNLEIARDLKKQREQEILEQKEEEEFQHLLEEQEYIGDKIDRINSQKPQKKGMSIIVVIAFLALFYVLLTPEEKPVEKGPEFANIVFPVAQEVEDLKGAKLDLDKGRALYSKGTYLAKAAASSFFVSSLTKKFAKNDAIGDLINVYTELIEDSKDPKLSANTVIKLIQIAENKMLTDVNVVTGAALFFNRLEKYQTGINIVKDFLRYRKILVEQHEEAKKNGTKPPEIAVAQVSLKLWTYLLDLQINAGDLVEARKTFNNINAQPKKTVESYFYLAKFHETDDHRAEARDTIEEGLKYYPDSVLLLLKYADYLVKEQNYSKYEEVLKKVEKLNMERSPHFAARFYYHMGLASALRNKNKEAAVFFEKSLKIRESDELRSMLSSLEIGGDATSKKLILESKVQELLKKANAELKNNNIESAFTYAIEASDSYPDYVPAILFQSKLQIRRGLYGAAISTLQNAISNKPKVASLRKALIEAYIAAYKLTEAQVALTELSQTTYSVEAEYASIMADFHLASLNKIPALRWYEVALSRDPLRDYDLYQRAKLLFQVKRFDEALKNLNRARFLDPTNPDYIVLYAEIIFEQGQTDSAIGYLREVMSTLGENPKFIAEISTLYYKSGQIKEFQSYYKKVQAMPKKDEGFYEFLMKAARIEEKKDDYENYAKELFKLNPGNLRVRLEYGEYLTENKKYDEAILQYEVIKERLPSYPKVHYYLAKLYLATLNIKKAEEVAKEELKLNPNLATSHFINGEVARINGDYRQAIIHYENAISKNAKSVDALMAMAWVRMRQNNSRIAIDLYSQALKEEPNNPEIHKQIAYAYLDSGQRAIAKEKFEDYLKLSPGAPDKDQIEAQIRNLR